MLVGLGRADPRSLDAAAGRVRGADQHVDLFGLHDGGGREVPEIFADQDAHPAEAGRIEGQEPLAGGEVALLVEQAVGRQIDLAVQVDDPPALGVQGRVVEAMLRRLFDEAQHHGHRPGGVEQFADFRGVGRDGHVGHHVADEVAGQRQFREDDQVGLLRAGRLDLLQVQGHVPLPIGQHRRDLGQGHAVDGRAGGGDVLGEVISPVLASFPAERQFEAHIAGQQVRGQNSRSGEAYHARPQRP